MHRFNTFLGLFAASLATGQRCGEEDLSGVPVPSPQQEVEFAVLAAQAAPPPPVNLFVHITASSTSRADGYLTVAEVDRQVQIIREKFAPAQITFNHNPATQRRWTVNAAYTGNCDSVTCNPMKEALHVGDYRTLNLYLRPMTSEQFGGTCTNPFTQTYMTPDLTTRVLRDGCVVNQQTLDGAGHPFMNLGLTAVHEIGHWFSLIHPFESWGGNQCSQNNVNDYVLDTPRCIAANSNGCDLNQDTCPSDPGLDPVQNYMFYSSDSCYTHFTAGQIERMHYGYQTWRTNVTVVP